MKGNLDASAKVFGAGIILTHLRAFDAENEGVSNSQDIEVVHRMRVASRRLRCTLPLFSPLFPKQKFQRWSKSITRVSHDLGAVRDKDVQIDFLRTQALNLPDEHYRQGLNCLILRLSQSHEKLRRKMLVTLEKIDDQGILKEMTKMLKPWAELEDRTYLYTPVLYSLSYEAITTRLDRFLSYEEFIFDPDRVKEIHAMRMAAKWLRYTCETFETLYSDRLAPSLQCLRTTQEVLGSLHDCDVWIQFMPKFMGREEKRALDYFGNVKPYQSLVPGFTFILEQKQKLRLSLYQTFIETWQQWQSEQVWRELRQSIQTPFPQKVESPAPAEEPSRPAS